MMRKEAEFAGSEVEKCYISNFHLKKAYQREVLVEIYLHIDGGVDLSQPLNLQHI